MSTRTPTVIVPEHPYRSKLAWSVPASALSQARGTAGERVPVPLQVMATPPEDSLYDIARVNRIRTARFEALESMRRRAALRAGVAAALASFMAVMTVGCAALLG